jgi:hypothetical protein
MNEEEIKNLKKRVYDIEQTIDRILPLGDALELRVKALEARFQLLTTQDAPTIQE